MRDRPGRWLVLCMQLFLVFTGIVVPSVAFTGTAAGADTGGYPYAEFNGPGTDPSVYTWTDSTGRATSDYGFNYRNCTDFVAWKLNVTNGLVFKNSTPKGSYGNAYQWGDMARKNGFILDMNPARGAVAWWDTSAFDMSGYGHVAWVKEVNGDQVTVEEYNNPPDGSRHIRTFHKSKVSGYIHFKDLDRLPEGQVIQNLDVPHARYVAAGGSLFYYNKDAPGLDAEFVSQMHQKLGNDATVKPMYNEEIKRIEGSPWSNPRRRPDNNTFLIDKAGNPWYMMQYGHSWWLRSPEELAYLGGSGKQIVVPAGSTNGLASQSTEWPVQIPDSTGDETLLKALNEDAYYEMQAEMMYWADNNTVIDCIVRYKGGNVQQVPLSMIQRFVDDGRKTGNLAHCSFPTDVAFYGPRNDGSPGAERWHIAGSNPYTRAQYASPLALRCWLGSNPAQVEISRDGVNQPTQIASRDCPNNTYLRNTSTQQVFQWWDGQLRYIATPETLSCLTAGHPEVVINVEEAAFGHAPQGTPATCEFEGKLIQAPAGQVYWVKDGSRHYVGNPTILNCISVRANAGNPIAVPQATVNGYTETHGGYCPYPAEVRFIRGNGQPQVWRIFPDGTRQHAASLCATNAENPATDPRFRVHVMPAGEVDGHRMRSPDTFHASPEACGAIV